MASVKLGPEPLDLLGVRAGDANEIAFTLKQNGVAMDLTNSTVIAQARKVATDAVAVIEADYTAVDETLGKFILTWDGDKVRTMLNGALEFIGVWDLQVIPTGALGKTVVAGVFKANMDVSRV